MPALPRGALGTHNVVGTDPALVPVIVAAKRTPVANFRGTLSPLQAHDLAAQVIDQLCESTSIEKSVVDEVIIGQVLQGLAGMNPARQAALGAGLPVSVPAYGVNKVCGSGLKAIHLAAQQIRLGDAEIIIAGGMESMTNAPHAMRLREGVKMGSGSMDDTMLNDGLTCAMKHYHMGVTAENVARQFSVNREMQDRFAADSQRKAAAAQAAGRFKASIVPISLPKARDGSVKVFDTDEYIKPNTTYETLAKLRPAFDRKEGTVTAGSASGINDGAALVVVMSLKKANQMRLPVLARITACASAAIDPSIMGMGPVKASQKALDKAGWAVRDLDIIEANEAFASQACAVNKEMGWDPARVNVNGGSIAIGHPIGASGARIFVDLLHEMNRQKLGKTDGRPVRG